MLCHIVVRVLSRGASRLAGGVSGGASAPRRSKARKTERAFGSAFVSAAVAVGCVVVPMWGGAGVSVARGQTLPVDASVKRIYLALDDHTDYFWTANASDYRAAFGEMLDNTVARADADIAAGVPSEQQNRFNADGSYWIYEYQKSHSAADFAKVVGKLQSGHITIPYNALVVSPGISSLESYTRGMFYAARLSRQYGFTVDTAVSMENATLPLGLASVWAKGGAKYSWKGVCGCATSVQHVHDERTDEVYYYQGNDGSKILMKWYSLGPQFPGASDRNQGPGGYAEARFPQAAIDYVSTDPGFLARNSADGTAATTYNVVGLFGKGWDDFKTIARPGDPDDFSAVAAANTDATRRVYVSNQRDFFQDFAASYGTSLPTQRVSRGNEWEISSANMSEQAARIKRAVEKLRTAEALSAVVSRFDRGFYNAGTRPDDREKAFLNMQLFYEHNMGMQYLSSTGSLTLQRIDWQKQIATETQNYVDGLTTDAAARLGQLIAKPAGVTNTRFYAFNPLGNSRSTFVDLPYTGSSAVRVYDVATNTPVDAEVLTLSGQQVLRVAASGVPAAGYRTFELRSETPGTSTNFATWNASTRTLTTPRYQLTLATSGAISSLLDLTDGSRQLVAASSRLNELTASGATISVLHSGPLSITLRAVKSSGTATDPARETLITLYRDSARIDLENRINQNFGDNVQTWKFNFNVPNAVTRHEEVGAVLTAKLASQGGDYADDQARYDWLTANHFIDISSTTTGRGITLSNWDLSLFKLGNSTPTFLDAGSSQISILGGGRIISEDSLSETYVGDTVFLQRFSLLPHAGFDATAAMQFALEHQNPLLAGVVTGSASAPLSPATYSLLAVDNPNTLLWALKPSEDDPANLVARVWNQSGQTQSLSAALDNPYVVYSATSTETPTGVLPGITTALRTSISPYAAETYLLVPFGIVPEPGVGLAVLAGAIVPLARPARRRF